LDYLYVSKSLSTSGSHTRMLYPPPRWTNAPVRLYHGTSERDAQAIVAGDVNVAGRDKTDFGPGFYTTTVERQARTWADRRAKHRARMRPAVVAIDLDREALASLAILAFVRGDFDADDFWSFVAHCRTGAVDHGRVGPRGPYDVVVGPVSAMWVQRLAIQGVDQVSFHTRAAQRVLNSSRRFVSWTSSP
jgi:hypothetical protein